MTNPATPAQMREESDYFGSLVRKARTAATKASLKFPQPNYVTLKIAEEAGEVVRGAVHYAEGRMEWPEVEGEIVQLLAMLIRFVTEGDEINGVIPPSTLPVAEPEPQTAAQMREAIAILTALSDEYNRDDECEPIKLHRLIERGEVLLRSLPVAEPAPVAVRVKPLVWQMEKGRQDDCPKWIADVDAKRYEVFKAWWGDQDKWGFVALGEFYHTEDAAKAAAEADHAVRVLSQIEALPAAQVRAELADGSFYKEVDIDRLQERAEKAEAERDALLAALKEIADGLTGIARDIQIGPDDEGREIYDMVLAMQWDARQALKGGDND